MSKKTPTPETKKQLGVVEIDERLSIARARRSELEEMSATAALDLVSEHTPGEDHLYDELTAKISAVDREIGALEAARPIALQNQKRAEAAARDHIWKGKLEACHTHLRVRDKAATELTEHLQGAVAALAKLTEAGRKARAAAPLTPAINWRAEAFVEDDQITTALTHELFRLGRQDRVGQGLWPGAVNPLWGQTTDTSKIKSLPEVIATASKFIVARLKGEVAQQHTEPSEFVHAPPIEPLSPSKNYEPSVEALPRDARGFPTAEQDATVPPRRPAPSLLPKGSTPPGRIPT